MTAEKYAKHARISRILPANPTGERGPTFAARQASGANFSEGLICSPVSRTSLSEMQCDQKSMMWRTQLTFFDRPVTRMPWLLNFWTKPSGPSKALTVGTDASELDSRPLIRQSLCSPLCSRIFAVSPSCNLKIPGQKAHSSTTRSRRDMAQPF